MGRFEPNQIFWVTPQTIKQNKGTCSNAKEKLKFSDWDIKVDPSLAKAKISDFDVQFYSSPKMAVTFFDATKPTPAHAPDEAPGKSGFYGILGSGNTCNITRIGANDSWGNGNGSGSIGNFNVLVLKKGKETETWLIRADNGFESSDGITISAVQVDPTRHVFVKGSESSVSFGGL